MKYIGILIVIYHILLHTNCEFDLSKTHVIDASSEEFNSILPFIIHTHCYFRLQI
jgi:hypothetical protein